jgi:hypothetical protein
MKFEEVFCCCCAASSNSDTTEIKFVFVQCLGSISIITKWCFVNGITTDHSATNLQFLLLHDALGHVHINEWTVDWDLNLMVKEIGLVMELLKDPFF